MYRLDRKIDKNAFVKHTWFFVGIFHWKCSILQNPDYFIVYTIMFTHEIVIRCGYELIQENSAPAFQANTM